MLSCLVVLSACDKKDNGEKAAEALLKEARTMLASGDYGQARLLIDSLRSTYPRAFDARRKAIELMDEIEMKQARHDLAATDSTLTALGLSLSTMKQDFLLEKDPRFQTVGFYKDRQQSASSLHRTCLYAEVDEEGQLFLVSVLNGKRLKHDVIVVGTGTDKSIESPQCFSFLTDNTGGYEEQATFKKGSDNGIVEFIAENSGSPIYVECKGSDGHHRYDLSKSDVQAIVHCNELERAMQRERQLKHSADSLRLKAKFFQKKKEKEGMQPAEEKILDQKSTDLPKPH